MVALVPALAGCGLVGGSGSTQRASSVVVGLLAPATGPDAADGKAALQGAQLAIELVNAHFPALPLKLAGGLSGGVKMVLATGDTRSDPAAAADEAARLARQPHVVGLVAADSAGVVSTAAARAEELKVPLVDACTSADALVQFGRDWYYRTGPTDRMQAQTAFALMREQRGPDPTAGRRLAVLEGVSTQDTDPAGPVRQYADDEGYDMVARVPVSGSSSGADLAGRLGPERPDVVIAVVGTDQEAAVVTDVAQRMKSLPVLVLGHGVGGLASGAAPAGGGRGVLRTVGWSADLAARNPTAKAVAELYQRRFGVPMSDSAAAVFTAMLTLAMAVDGAGPSDRTGNGAKVRAALRRVSLPATQTIMPGEGVRFDGTGQNQLAAAVVEQRAPGGFQVVYPREVATLPLTWKGH